MPNLRHSARDSVPYGVSYNLPHVNRRPILLSLLLAVLTLLAYWPAYRGGFIWDDARHVSENTLLHSVEGLGRIWFEIGATPQYYPLTHTTFWLEWHLWGDATLGYHVVNVLLHIAAALLVVRLLRVLQIPGAWLAGFVFALHPVHVESVAWISERKNTLSIVFLLASILTYWRWRETAGTWRGWAAAFALFLCAVFSKTVAGAMPAVVLVIVAWKSGRLRRRDVRPLLPMLAVSLAAAALTGRMEREVVGAEGEDWSLSLAQRFLVANRALWWYAGKLVWPSGLAFSYGRWQIDVHDVAAWSFVGATVAIAVLLGLSRRRLGGGVIAAALIFAGTLFPALGFFNLFPHRYSFVADHFQYYADVAGIAVLCAAAVLLAKRLPAWAGRAWAVTLVLLLATMSFGQARIYKSFESIWLDTIVKTPTSWLAFYNLGTAMSGSRTDPAELEQAVAYLRTAERLRPQHDGVHVTLMQALSKLGSGKEAWHEYDLALGQYRRLMREVPSASAPYLRLTALYDSLGFVTDATEVYVEASNAIPRSPFFAQQAAEHLLQQRRPREAIPFAERWAAVRPDELKPHLKLAFLYGQAGRVMEARRELQRAAAIAPDDAEVQRGFDLAHRSLLGNPAATLPSGG